MIDSLYIVISNGCAESIWASEDKDHVLMECQQDAIQYISDFHRHERDWTVSPEQVGIRLFQVTYGDVQQGIQELELPLQKWADEYFEELSQRDRHEANAKTDPEWAEYCRLKEKFRGVY